MQASDELGGRHPFTTSPHWRALAAAAAQLAVGWALATRDDTALDEGCTFVAELCTAIREAADGGSMPALVCPAAVPGRRLLEMLRRLLLDQSLAQDPPLDGTRLLRMLLAIEQAQAALDAREAPGIEDQLARPGSLNLLVEVAHDLRAPLSSILLLVETLYKGRSGTINSVQEHQLGIIYSAALGLSMVTSDAIELARAGDRLVDAHPVPFSVAEVLQTVHDVVRPMSEAKGLDVQLVFPGSDGRLGHPLALQRVLLNLTTNALKYTREGQIVVGARATTRSELEFWVQDTGPGIPPDVVSRIFQPFHEGRRPGTFSFSSSGLGLSICRKLVEAMGSELTLATSLGEGTRFSFALTLETSSRL